MGHSLIELQQSSVVAALSGWAYFGEVKGQMHQTHEVFLLADEQLEGVVVEFVEDAREAVSIVTPVQRKQGLVKPDGQAVCKLVELNLDAKRALDASVTRLINVNLVEEVKFIWVS